jgi:hypothetical protein
MGGESETGEMTLVANGNVSAGVSSFTGENLPAWIRVDALDLDNRTIGTAVQVAEKPIWKFLAEAQSCISRLSALRRTRLTLKTSSLSPVHLIR